MNDLLSTITQNIQLTLVFKIVILFVLFLYGIYTFILLSQVKELSKVVFIYAKHASQALLILGFLYFFLTISLFFIALVIL